MIKRIHSIDVFRAVTMLLMIFVNDFWTLKGIPGWLEHSVADQDFLGFSDIIFPCFLFIVGIAIPYAIRNRIDKGDSHLRIFYHIFLRSVALLVMGFFTVNIDSLNTSAAVLSRGGFQILMVIGFFLIWNVYPKVESWKKYLYPGLQISGILLLLVLFFLFKGGEDGDGHMSPQWWGILGLIGWAYLVTAVIYLFARKSPIILILFWLLFIILNIAGHNDWMKINIPGGVALEGFTFAGVVASLMFDRAEKNEKTNSLAVLYLGMGLLLLIAGFISREFFIISKIRATPTWVFLCNGIAFAVFAVFYFLVDVKGKDSWFKIIKPAGTSTLTCYLVPYVYYSLAVYAFTLPAYMKTGAAGLLKSFIFAMLIIGITALLGKLRIRLKI